MQTNILKTSMKYTKPAVSKQMFYKSGSHGQGLEESKTAWNPTLIPESHLVLYRQEDRLSGRASASEFKRLKSGTDFCPAHMPLNSI